jgi:antitoxin component HigA of HigAB toxin-antitoxin module
LKRIGEKEMKKEVPDPDELKELIRVKIDIYGLTMEDIDYLKNQSSRILSGRQELRI